MPEVHDSFCRFCHASCAIKVTVDEGRLVSVIGAKDNPVYHGYTCAKGRALPEQHLNPARLLHSVKRDEEGSHHNVPVEQAMDASSIAPPTVARTTDSGQLMSHASSDRPSTVALATLPPLVAGPCGMLLTNTSSDTTTRTNMKRKAKASVSKCSLRYT